MWDGKGQGAPEPVGGDVREATALFGETADPANYVPRLACERVLAELERAIGREPGCAALTAAPGMGKSLLLRVLAERLADHLRCVYLPYAALTLGDLCAWTIGLLGQPVPADPATGLRLLAQRTQAEGSAIALLIDDANSMPIATAREFGSFLGDCGGSLRAVLADADDARTSRVIAALGLDVVDCRLSTPMSEVETRGYIAEQLCRSDTPPALRLRLGAAVTERIHSMSRGVPRRVNALAREFIAGGEVRGNPDGPACIDDELELDPEGHEDEIASLPGASTPCPTGIRMISESPGPVDRSRRSS